MITKGNNQSMELDRESSSGYWANSDNSSHRIFIYNEALIKKLCVLGEHFEPCFEGASIAAFSLNSPEFEEFKTTMFSMINELKEAITKGGSDMEEENKNILPVEGEEPVTETFAAEETSDVESAPAEGEFVKKVPEDNSDKENKDKKEDKKETKAEDKEEDKKEDKKEDEDDYSAKYQELTDNYAALEAQYNELKDKYAALEAEKTELDGEVAGLREYKLAGERKAKEDMIAKFYMLDDEAKKDCVENIDKYSLDEIEAQLSVYCFRNGINFASEEENSEEQEIQPTTFNLNNTEDADDAPEWVKAVRRIQNKEEF